jgi:hypothetical protein
MIYTAPVHNVLDACISITWGSGRGLGPGILEFFGPQMALLPHLAALALYNIIYFLLSPTLFVD